MPPIVNSGWKTGDRPGKEERPLHVMEGNKVTDRAARPGGIRPLWRRVFDEWVKGDVGVQHFDTVLAEREAARFAGVGRDPCPWDDGQKFKKCHGAGEVWASD